MSFAPRFIRVYEGQFQKLISRFAKSAYPASRLLPPVRTDRGIALVGFRIRHKPIRTRGLGADIRRIRHLVVRHAAVLTFRGRRALRIRETGATRLSVPLHRPAEFAFGRAVRFFITRTPLSPVRIGLAAIRTNRCGIAVGRIPARARLGSVPHRRTAEFADGRAVRGIPTSAVLSSVRRRLPAELANGVDRAVRRLIANTGQVGLGAVPAIGALSRAVRRIVTVAGLCPIRTRSTTVPGRAIRFLRAVGRIEASAVLGPVLQRIAAIGTIFDVIAIRSRPAITVLCAVRLGRTAEPIRALRTAVRCGETATPIRTVCLRRSAVFADRGHGAVSGFRVTRTRLTPVRRRLPAVGAVVKPRLHRLRPGADRRFLTRARRRRHPVHRRGRHIPTVFTGRVAVVLEFLRRLRGGTTVFTLRSTEVRPMT